MNILHVLPDLDPRSGGIVTAVKGLAAAQADLGHEARISATYVGVKPELSGLKSVVDLYPAHPIWHYSYGIRRGLEESIKAADIVHAHSMWDYPTLCAISICNKLKKPCVLSPHGMLDTSHYARSILKKNIYIILFGKILLNSIKAVHFTSEMERSSSCLFGFRPKCVVLPLGLPRKSIERLPERGLFGKEFERLHGKKYVLFLGRLHPKKNPKGALRAFRLLAEPYPNLFLVLAGPGQPRYVRRLQKLAEELHLADRVLFTGMIGLERKMQAYRDAVLFLLPSHRENFGMAVLEAMAAACPVVISPFVDLAGEIRSARAGFVCAQDPIAAASEMKKILDDPAMGEEMGNNGRRLVLEKFTWDAVAPEFIKLYKKL